MSNIHDEEALGKAYDSHLLKRLLEYLRPYRWRVILALAFVAIVTPLELAPPKLFQIAIDKYLVPGMRHELVESAAWRGIQRMAAGMATTVEGRIGDTKVPMSLLEKGAYINYQRIEDNLAIVRSRYVVFSSQSH